MRATVTHSRWGNLYRRRYYLDGKRVSDDEFARRTAISPEYDNDPAKGYRMTFHDYGFRQDWDFVRDPDTEETDHARGT